MTYTNMKALPVLKKRYLGPVLAAGLLFLFLRKADWGVLESDFRSTVWAWVALAILLRFAGLAIASMRWRVLLSPLKRIAIAPLLSATMMGISADMLIAMQSAEIIRPLLLSRWEGIPFGSTFATVVVEWFVDLLGILVLLVPAALVFRGTGVDGALPQLVALGRIIPAILAASTLALVLLWSLHRLEPAAAGYFQRKLQANPGNVLGRVSGGVMAFIRGLGVMRQPIRLAQVTFYSVSASLCLGLCTWAVLNAFRLTIPIGASFIMLGFIALGGLIPTPGAVGGFHAACQLGLAVVLHIDPARAVLPVIGLHAILYLPPALLGLFFMSSKGLKLASFQDIAAAARLGA